jgi:lysophospholipase L1-like esterase
MGGSTTEEGPIEQETYPNYLEKMLMERVKEFSKIEVINAGIPGITINKLWFRIPDLLLMQPDLIIFCEGANDITHIFLPYWIKQLGVIKNGY